MSDAFDPTQLARTKKKKELSLCDSNRNYVSQHLKVKRLEEAMKHYDAYSKAQKLHGSYVYPLLHHRIHHPEDRANSLLPHISNPLKGMAFPTWYAYPSYTKEGSGSSGGTVQARITCKGPALQTFPPRIQKAMTSRYEGGSIIAADISGAELRVAALLSGDVGLTRELADGSVHVERAKYLFGANEFDYDDEAFKETPQYAGAKTTVFADLFLSRPETMHRAILTDVGLSLPLAMFQGLVADRHVLRPEFYQWQLDLIQEACDKNIIILPLTGHSRQFPGAPETVRKDQSTIVDFPIQTVAALTLLDIQHKLRELLPSVTDPDRKICMLAQIYDSTLLDCHPDHVDEALDMIRIAFEWTQTHGYYKKISDHYGNVVPLAYKIKTTKEKS